MQPQPRHLTCSICSQIRDYESATEYVHQFENNSELPQAANKLKVAREIKSSFQLKQCPECDTYYLYRTHYEFLIGFGGSYDEAMLKRISDEIGKDYLEGRLSTPPIDMIF